MRTTLGLKVDVETEERLRTLASQTDRSPHWLMKRALEEYLDREERRERERREDQERWERFQLAGTAVSEEVAAAWLSALAQGEDTPCPD